MFVGKDGDKHSGLLWKGLTYDRKMLKTLTTRPNVIKRFMAVSYALSQ
jgi:hypothetical protein